jgi:hypothetical protein
VNGRTGVRFISYLLYINLLKSKHSYIQHITMTRSRKKGRRPTSSKPAVADQTATAGEGGGREPASVHASCADAPRKSYKEALVANVQRVAKAPASRTTSAPDTAATGAGATATAAAPRMSYSAALMLGVVKASATKKASAGPTANRENVSSPRRPSADVQTRPAAGIASTTATPSVSAPFKEQNARRTGLQADFHSTSQTFRDLNARMDVLEAKWAAMTVRSTLGTALTAAGSRVYDTGAYGIGGYS